MRLFKYILVGVAAIIATLFISHSALANSLGVEPLFMEVRPGQSAAIRVNNTSDADAPVEIYVHERIVDINGVQTRRVADDDFIVFPPQAVIPASKTQVFRLQPINKTATESKSYYVSIRQLPVDLGDAPEQGARVQIVFAFDAAVHVIPRKAEAIPVAMGAKLSEMKIKVPTGRYENDDEGEPIEVIEEKIVPAVEMTLRNDGSRYLYLQDQEYILNGTMADGNNIDFPGWSVDDVLQSVAVVLVQPQSKRTFKLPLPEGMKPSNLSFKVKARR